LELHENNAIVLYSTTLSRQIPTSFAANAFRVFQTAMARLWRGQVGIAFSDVMLRSRSARDGTGIYDISVR
jgi:hypothetical protein